MNAQSQEELISEEKFWTLVEASSERLEHVGGRVYAMAGGGYIHARLIVRLSWMLERALQGKKCTSLGNEFYVQVEATGDRLLPDNVVHCQEPKLGKRGLTLLNPLVVFEVLSPGTESYDQGDKFDMYAQIPSLSDYILISQNFVKVTHFSRQANGWLRRTFMKLEDVVQLPQIEVELSLRELYDGMNVPLQFIMFPQPESDQ